MTRRTWSIGWSGWIAVSGVVLFLFSAIFGLISMLLPYIASRGSQIFCLYILPPIIFMMLFGVVLIGRYRAHHDPTGKLKAYEGSWFRLVLGLLIMAFGWSLMISLALAIPTNIFAKNTINVPVMVRNLNGFRLNYDYWTWISFDRNGSTERFMWTRADPLMRRLKPGDCIMLHARKWPLGIYVDSISRSNACQSPSEAGLGTTSTHAQESCSVLPSRRLHGAARPPSTHSLVARRGMRRASCLRIRSPADKGVGFNYCRREGMLPSRRFNVQAASRVCSQPRQASNTVFGTALAPLE